MCVHLSKALPPSILDIQRSEKDETAPFFHYWIWRLKVALVQSADRYRIDVKRSAIFWWGIIDRLMALEMSLWSSGHDGVCTVPSLTRCLVYPLYGNVTFFTASGVRSRNGSVLFTFVNILFKQIKKIPSPRSLRSRSVMLFNSNCLCLFLSPLWPPALLVAPAPAAPPVQNLSRTLPWS